MKKFYEKNELWFSILWIIIYVMVMGNMRASFGDNSLYSLLAVGVIAVVLSVFIIRNGLQKKYGFTGVKDSGKYLYFIPFVLLCTVNLWFGVAMRTDPVHLLTGIAVMGLAGYVEEVIFRGLLFRAIEKESTKQAIIISAVTFGAGHIVNLLTGHAAMDTILQMVYAIAIGFSFVVVFYKSRSLIPCIVTHSVINMTSQLANMDAPMAQEMLWQIIPAVFLTVVAGGYAWYVWKKVN